MRKRWIISCLLAAVLCLAACAPAEGDDPTPTGTGNPPYDPEAGIDRDKQIGWLVSQGSTQYRVVIPENASEAEFNAANEFTGYIQRVTGVGIPVITDAAAVCDTEKKYVSIGDTALFRAQDIDCSDLNLDGFVLKTVDNTLFIKGQRDKGTLYGVYDFLEKIVGVKFLSATYEHIPASDRVPLYRMDTAEKPAFLMRSDYYRNMANSLSFSGKMRFIAPNQSRNADSIGGGFYDDWATDFHSVYELVNFNEWYKKHPEWFSAPSKQFSQPCYSNGLNEDGTLDDTQKESFIKVLIARVKEIILERPEVVWFMIGQEDNNFLCNCGVCEHRAEVYGSRTGALIVFVNAVVREVERWMAENNIDRRVNFATFAYAWSFRPPVVTAPDGTVSATHELCVPLDNVYVMLAPIDACYNHGLDDDDCSVNRDNTTAVIEKWRAITDNFLIFDYHCNFSDFLTWHPNMGVLKDNVLYYREIGAGGIISEGSPMAENYYQGDLECWLLSKLLWNPDRDVTELTAEFNRYYFGERAGAVMDEFLSFVNVHYERASITGGDSLQHATTFSTTSAWLVSIETLNPAFLATAYRYINEAKKQVAEDAALTDSLRQAYLRNIQSAEIQVQYMMYKNYDSVYYTTEEAKYEFLLDFFDKVQEIGVSYFSELGEPVGVIRAELGI